MASAAPPSPSVDEPENEEVKQPISSALSSSVVFVSDTSRLATASPSVALSSSLLSLSPSQQPAAAVDDPFGPPSSEWAVAASASSSSSVSSSAPSDDPFSVSTAEPDTVSSSLDAFAAFPKPGHVDEQSAQTERGRARKASKNKKKSSKRAQQRAASSAGQEPSSSAAGPSSAGSAVSSLPVAATAGLTAAEGDSGLLMADSAEYVAMLEARLERLKKKQEARIKAATAKTTRRTSNATRSTLAPCHVGYRATTALPLPLPLPLSLSLPPLLPLPMQPALTASLTRWSVRVCLSAEFVSITTSDALNETDEKAEPPGEKTAQQQQQQSAAVHMHATVAPSATTSRSTAPQPANAAATTAAAAAAGRHRTQIGLHSAPFDEDEVQAIMQSSVPPSAVAAAVVDERGELVEDPAMMASSDGEAVGVVQDKTAYYENKNNLDEQNNCSVM